MKKPYFKIDGTRLRTTDERGNRVYIHPEDLKGRWKSRRLVLYWFLILLYLVVPWIYVDGKQWVLLDIARREFRIFGSVFLGHDVPYLFLVLAAFALVIAGVTAIGGRLWCGWACPQTVFLDAIFRKIEGFVEGNSREQRRLDEAPLGWEKVWKRGFKWLLFTVVSLHIAHSFLGYFVGTHRLLRISMQAPAEHWPLFVTMLVITGIVLFDFGWFREQFCIIMCPYGRLQGVLMDQNSLVVAYDAKRGEPRKAPQDIAEDRGDCVNCYQCVRVCPTGIDIRNGSQLECIACTACIDACDSIMEKLDKPRGLIRYTTENALEGRKTKVFGPRLFVYLALLAGLAATATLWLASKDDLRVLVQRSKVPFSVTPSVDGAEPVVMNSLKLEFYVQAAAEMRLHFELEPKLASRGGEIITAQVPYVIQKAGRNVANVFVKFPQSLLKEGSLESKLLIYQETGADRVLLLEKDIILIGPL